MFTFGLELRPWDDLKVLADGPSIRRYIADTAAEFGIDEKIHYGLKIVSADWSTAEQRWTVTALVEASGESRTYTCAFLVGATGYYDYDAGYLPDFPGTERFRGRIVHPQHWPADLDVTGKKVVVIGSGATAVTLVPALAGRTAHVTMLQRSPGYILSLPDHDKISEVMRRFLPRSRVYRSARRRNIVTQRWLYNFCRRHPREARRLLLWQVKRQVGAHVDMKHFTPSYRPWDERLCAVPNGDLFKALAGGRASIATDVIETFTEDGLLLESGETLAADVVVTATGLRMQMLGGMSLSVDGEARELHKKMAYKGVLVQDVPNLLWVFGYINASWTLKAEIAGTYLCRLLRHMDAHGQAVATPRDDLGCAVEDARLVDGLRSGYVQRGRDLTPRQGTGPWEVVMDHQHNCRVLLEAPIVDGVLQFESAVAAKAGVTVAA
jgi:cation diffusion facilitator CzcD-associated flavoprotein CzcO